LKTKVIFVVNIIKIPACQVPDIREDVDGALSWIERYARKANVLGVQLLCFPKCFLQGYVVKEAFARGHAMNLASAAFTQVLQRLADLSPMLVFGLMEEEFVTEIRP